MTEIFPYQVDGALWLAGLERGGLHDDMGLGKTVQTIHALDMIGARRILIVAPAGVVDAGVWINELKRWSTVQRRALKGRTVHELGAWMKDRADVLTVSYEKATAWARHFDAAMELFDVVVFDEAHYLKTPDVNRTMRALGDKCDGSEGFARYFARVWFLTGTPLPNDPLDIWTTLHFAGGTPLPIEPFTKRYFKSFQTTFSRRQRGREEMLPELRQAIRAKFLRRTEEDVGLQLPPVWLTTITVDGDSDDVLSLLREYPDLDEAIRAVVEADGDMRGLSFLDAQHIATLRRLVGEAKAPVYAEMIAEELRNGLDSIVIGGLHTLALKMVADILTARGFAGALFIGATTPAQRQRAVDDFQAGKLRWIVGHLRSLGTGITLTHSAATDIFEEDWSPAVNAQFLKRVHRIGQKRAVRSRFVSLSNSIDEIVSERVKDKTAAIMAVQET